MKKTITTLLAALVLGSGAAFAQDYGYFNHLSIGVGLVGTDGEGLQVAAPIGSYVQMRAGVTTQALDLALVNLATKNIPEVGGISPFKKSVDMGIEYNDIKIDKLDIEARAKSTNMQLLFDIFPGKNTSFHFTVGAYFSLNPAGLVSASAKPVRNDGQSVFPGTKPYDTEIYGITSDPSGNFLLDLQWTNKVVRPYVGIGFGRPVSLDRRVGVNFDMGIAYLGGINLVSYSYYNYDKTGKPETVKIDADFIDKKILSDTSMDESTRNTFQEIKGYVSDANKYSKIYPILKLTLFIRLF